MPVLSILESMICRQVRNILLFLIVCVAPTSASYIESLQAVQLPLGSADDLAPLIGEMADCRLVLLGEGSHGTREFYTWRDEISRRLISRHGFSFVAVEGDWNALSHLNDYVHGRPGAATSAREALQRIDRWPLWMWSNREFAAFGEWLRRYNEGLPPAEQVGVYGIDVYGMWDSLEAVLHFYDKWHPASSAKVEEYYAALRPHRDNNSAYINALRQRGRSGASGATAVVAKLRQRLESADDAEKWAWFDALQHAKVVKYGERHLRAMTVAGPGSWNARAEHFANTVDRLLEQYGPQSKGIVWAHNTHIGDARATSMGSQGQMNIGQLARQRHGDESVFALGFATGAGSVMAAREWEGAAENMSIPTPPPDTLEGILSANFSSPAVFLFEMDSAAAAELARPVVHRAIGVVYHPEREQFGNFVPTRLSRRYDALVFFPVTRSVESLD